MVIGHFLTVGDKTSCGGVVLAGTSNITFYGRDAAIEGSFVTCGKHSGNFSIVGGVNCFFDMGTKLAGTLDSQSTCPCRANLINSIPDSYQNEAHFSNFTSQDVTKDTESTTTQRSHNTTNKSSSDSYAQSEQKIKPEPLPLPAVIFKTKRKMDDYDAEDMIYADLSEEQLKHKVGLTDVGVPCHNYSLIDFIAQAELPNENIMQWCNPYTMEDRDTSARMLFDKFRELSDLYSFVGEYQGLMRKMISHMQGNTGGNFTDPLLDKAMSERILEDTSDQSSLLVIKRTLIKNIDWDNGYYPLDKKGKLYEAIMGSILPKFDNIEDRVNGLGITVHDTWATHITLQSLEVNGNAFKATIHYHIQDHFGLDKSDVTHYFYKKFRIFRIWFLLQHWNQYGYKPFITEMNVTQVIEGSCNE
ncbi:PAAR domain-containing protein [Xenorhabdus bovienii]|uniref:PAAR domain-containing protein n=1 Tax=Xenorhabdus bovienii TaxID=40576 RepID=UPI0023B2CAA5|nr:PAAR domain-containing protein [Xenorhabdus bovienii]MDE9487447.1 DUF3289 family protein [Xenorhabdus bovienii]MDE9538724.1 DUF3289 family protein [Xenorhabdus bovienii]